MAMSAEQILGSFDACAQRLELRAKYRELPKAELRRLLFLCRTGKGFLESGQYDKAMRWLGFIQGAIWMGGHASIEEVKTWNGSIADSTDAKLTQVLTPLAKDPDVVVLSGKTSFNWRVFLLGDKEREQALVEATNLPIPRVGDVLRLGDKEVYEVVEIDWYIRKGQPLDADLMVARVSETGKTHTL